MKLDLTGLRIEVTDAIREFTERKIKKLDKFFDDATICHVTFTEKSKGTHDVDIRIEYKSCKRKSRRSILWNRICNLKDWGTN